MKSHTLMTAAFAIVALTAGCSDGTGTPGAVTATTEPAVATTEPGTSTSEPAVVTTQPATSTSDLAVSTLSADEIAGIAWMREEEQLAHDVYVALDEMWDRRVFQNISRSEQTHIDLTIGLLDQFDLVDPATGNEPGTFTDARIQALYDQLVADGSTSIEDALAVGAYIEELDIADLRARAAATDDPIILDVYERLERASNNHLRAFVSQLEMRDVEYEAQILPDLEAIVASPMERGADG